MIRKICVCIAAAIIPMVSLQATPYLQLSFRTWDRTFVPGWGEQKVVSHTNLLVDLSQYMLGDSVSQYTPDGYRYFLVSQSLFGVSSKDNFDQAVSARGILPNLNFSNDFDITLHGVGTYGVSYIYEWRYGIMDVVNGQISNLRIRRFDSDDKLETALSSDFSLSSVPEPGPWAMMILGFGIVGAVIGRARRRDVIACASVGPDLAVDS